MEKLNPQKDLSRNPLFDTMFIQQNMDLEEIKLSNLKISHYLYENNTAKFDITLTAVETADGISFSLEYRTKHFKKKTMERFTEHYLNILKKIAADPKLKLSGIDILSAAEKKRILIDFNDTRAEYPKDQTIYELFEEQATKTPDTIAVIFEDQQLTYGELNEKSNQLASLLRDKGVKPDSIVGIMVERSLEMMIGIMGILKAGGAYLPIDPNYPLERTGYMLGDSGTKILLTQSHLNHTGEFQGEIINLDQKAIYRGNRGNLEKINKPTDLTYVIYTSGSTGKPKGADDRALFPG